MAIKIKIIVVNCEAFTIETLKISANSGWIGWVMYMAANVTIVQKINI